MKITIAMLEEKRACGSQVQLFRETFGEEARVTLANCHKALAMGLSLDWAAQTLLPAPARKAYWEATATAGKAYDEAIATAEKAYREAIAPAWKAYHEATTTAGKAYYEAKATAGKAYREAIARAFYEAAKGVKNV